MLGDLVINSFCFSILRRYSWAECDQNRWKKNRNFLFLLVCLFLHLFYQQIWFSQQRIWKSRSRELLGFKQIHSYTFSSNLLRFSFTRGIMGDKDIFRFKMKGSKKYEERIKTVAPASSPFASSRPCQYDVSWSLALFVRTSLS